LSIKTEKENRKEGQSSFRLRLNAFNTCEPELLPDWQALPLEQAIPLNLNENLKD
jgi:hypothetical protein